MKNGIQGESEWRERAFARARSVAVRYARQHLDVTKEEAEDIAQDVMLTMWDTGIVPQSDVLVGQFILWRYLGIQDTTEGIVRGSSVSEHDTLPLQVSTECSQRDELFFAEFVEQVGKETMTAAILGDKEAKKKVYAKYRQVAGKNFWEGRNNE